MPANLGPCQWKVADVCAYLKDDLEMPESVIEAFRDNAVSGPDFIALSDEDLKELGCKPLQARKIRNALTSMGFKPAGGAPSAAQAPAPAPTAAAPVPAPAPAAAPAAAAPAAAEAGAPMGYPPPASAAAYPPGYPPAGPPPPYYGAPPPAPAPAPSSSHDNTGKKVAAVALVTRPRRMMRRAAMID